MYVQWQNYPIPFTGGVDTKTDPKQVLAGNLLTLENGRFSNPGEIQKRSGFTKLGTYIEGTSDNITTGAAIQDFNNELILFDGTNIYSYVEQTGKWLDKGVAISVILDDNQITRQNVAQQENPDAAYLNGIECYAYEDTRNSGSVRYAVKDYITGNIVVADTNIATAIQPKTISFNGLFYIFYVVANTLFYQTVNPNNPTVITTPDTVLIDGYTNFSYDVSVIGKNMFIVYTSSNNDAGEIDVYYYNTALVLSSRYTIATGTSATNGQYPINVDAINNEDADGYAPSVVNIVGDSEEDVWVSWCNGSSVFTASYSQNMVNILPQTFVATAAATRLTGIESSTPTELILVWEQNDILSYNASITKSRITLVGDVETGGTLRSVGLASKCFSYLGNTYVNVAYDSSSTTTNEQCTYFVVLLDALKFEDENYAIIGKIASGVGGGLRTNTMLSEVVEINTNIFKFANLVKGPVISEGGILFSVLGVNSSQIDFENPSNYFTVQFSNNMLIVGGILQIYDGVSVFEQGYHYYPEGLTCTPAGSDGNLSTGTYSYCACYAWTDNYGQIHRSAPSPATIISATSNNHCTITVPTLRLTAKQSPRASVIIEIYRTQANASGLNPSFYLITSTLAPEQNSTSTDTITYIDLESDVNISTNPLLYTTGGVLDNIAAPANSLITLFNDRVILGGLEDSNLLWYSQNRLEIDNFNTTPVEFCAENTIGVDPRGGPITALGLLNQNLIIFKKTQIFYINGEGPDNTGQGTTFPDAIQIASDVGCSNPNSIVIMPAGIMFQSDKGIYLLGTGLTYPTYIGAPVQGYTGNGTDALFAGSGDDNSNLIISSATLAADQNLVLFTTSSGTTLVYDFYMGQWAVDTNQYAVDSVIFNDTFCFITSTGSVYTNNPTIFTDAGNPIYMSWTTPNLSFAQLNGYQRVRRMYLLGSYRGTHTLDISVAYDYNDTYTYSTTVSPSPSVTVWGSDTTWGAGSPWGGEFVAYEFRVDFNIQKCTAIRIQISDNQTSSYNEGYAISALTFQVGIMPGAVRLPATAQYGTK